jgi:hypothetical protein
VSTTVVFLNVAHPVESVVVGATKSIWFCKVKTWFAFFVDRRTMAALASLPLGGIVLHDILTLPPLDLHC